ncbi:MAG: TetR/AcrR family transcriptional regulator [Acidimicrobiales bacterium]
MMASTGQQVVRGRPCTIDRSRILAAARELPIDQLTMASLARHLGVTPAALYHYFPNRDAVFDALAADLVDGVTVPDPELPWSDFLEQLAGNLRAHLLDSPWALALTGRTHPVGAGLRLVEQCLQVLMAAGFDARSAAQTSLLVIRFATMSAVFEATADPDREGAALFELAEREPDAVSTITRHLDLLGPVDHQAEFSAQLAAVLAGVSANYAPKDSS